MQAFDISGVNTADKRVNQGFGDIWGESLAYIIINGTVFGNILFKDTCDQRPFIF